MPQNHGAVPLLLCRLRAGEKLAVKVARQDAAYFNHTTTNNDAKLNNKTV